MKSPPIIGSPRFVSTQVSAVKAHPQHFSPEALFSFPEGNPHLGKPPPFSGPRLSPLLVRAHTAHSLTHSLTLPLALGLSSTMTTARCKRAGHIDAFDRFVLLVRDPYDAIWSEYRRRTGAKVIRRNDFNRTAFATAARKMTCTRAASFALCTVGRSHK